MSDAQQPFGFGPFLPGMDFLQQLTKAGQSQVGGALSHWVSPSMSVEDIDKRIEELKAVQFWLEQNSRALTATVQALQVQKMTLSTLQSMNVNMGELTKVFPWSAAVASGGAAPSETAPHPAPAEGPASPLAGWPMAQPVPAMPDAAQARAVPVEPAPAPMPSAAMPEGAAESAAAAGGAQAMQWWGALTQQFQQIASQALQDPLQQASLQQAGSMATQWSQAVAKTASDLLQPRQSPAPTAAADSEHGGAAASVSGGAAKPKAASAGKVASKTATQAAAKTATAPSVRATTTAAPKSTAGQTGGADQGVAPVRAARAPAARKRSS